MVTDSAAFDKQHQVEVALKVGKSSKGEGWFSGSVKPAQFEEAIRASIERTRLFSGLTSEDMAKYVLDVTIAYASSHPGFTMTAWINVDWKLINSSTGDTVWSNSIQGEGRATVGEAFNGAKRQYMALERAGKANIDQAMSELGKLSL